MKTALITGITGQDGSYLAEFLLEKGYIVWGVVRRSSSLNTSRIDHIFDKLTLVHGDLCDSSNIETTVQKFCSQDAEAYEVYNLGAQSHVQVSFKMPSYTMNSNAVGTLNILNAIRNCGKPIKFYQASTSELYGLVQEIPQSETTPFYPRSPYAISKLAAYWTVVNYRESYNIFACNGILFNHESPRRGETFVTKKITRAVGNIKAGKQKELYLGNIDALRDWGNAQEYIRAMWLMLQNDTPEDFVIATGEQHSVREFVELAFLYGMGVKIQWRGLGIDEVGYEGDRIYVRIDKRYFRDAEVETLLGNPQKAKEKLGWTHKTSFKDLVEEMVNSDLFP